MMMTDVVFSIRNVSKSFGTLQVLKNVTFDIPKSKVFAIIGPSGAGKSTLVRTLNGLEGIRSRFLRYLRSGQNKHNKLCMSIGLCPVFQPPPHLRY